MRRATWIGGMGFAAAAWLAGTIGCGGGTPEAPAVAGTPTGATGSPTGTGAPAGTGDPAAPGAAAPMAAYDPATDPLRKPAPEAAAALKNFLMAMVARDDTALRMISIPANHPELPILWEGEKPAAEDLADAAKVIGDIAVFRVLPGDTMLGLDGKEVLVKESDVQSNQLLLTFEDNPIPFFVEQQATGWKVYAAPIIATRKLAAEEAKLRAQEAAAQNVQPPMQPGVQPASQLGSQPAQPGTGIVQPGIAPSGAVQPGFAQPGVAQPGGVQPGVVQPGAFQPGIAQPGVVQPGIAQPGVVQPGIAQPGFNQPGFNQPGFNQPGVRQPAPVQPGVVQPGVQPGVPQPGVFQPSLQPGAVQPGVVQPGVQPGVRPPAQPGAQFGTRPSAFPQQPGVPPGTGGPGALR